LQPEKERCHRAGFGFAQLAKRIGGHRHNELSLRIYEKKRGAAIRGAAMMVVPATRAICPRPPADADRGLRSRDKPLRETALDE
jgi:hypothetical protein